MSRSPSCRFIVALIATQASQVVQADPAPLFLDKWIVSTSISGMASDAHGNIVASDWENDTILVFDGDGQLIRQWGSTGSGDGQFRKPHGIAIAPSGEIYIADYFNRRLQIFDNDGNFLRKWEFFTPDEIGQTQEPNDVAIDAHGNVYVAHAVAYYRIKVYDSAGNFLRQLAPAGTPGIGWGPEVAVDRYGYVFAGTPGSGVSKFDPQGNFLWNVTQIPPFDSNWTPWGPCGSNILGPRDIFVDPSNTVFMSLPQCAGSLSSEGQFVYNVDSSMQFITRIGCVDAINNPDNPWFCRDPDGSGPFVVGDGKLHHPGAMTVDPWGQIYVFDDSEGGRIQKFGWATIPVQPTTWSSVKERYR